ncbi:MAG: glycoside hydrolase family 16 protein [Treponema sp.]|nr:glycoside hydrolase family 16 protein [Treponema sp.]MDY5123520.1 glycoside hydrolase family 16 protein [Treponema sp.]
MKKLIKVFTATLIGAAVLSSVSCAFFKMDDEGSTVNQKDIQTITINDKTLKLKWNDEFDKTDSKIPDTTKWKYQTGKNGWGNNEVQNYIDNTNEAKTAVVGDGVLTIKAYNEGGEWKSARMNSKQSFKYGYYEASLKVTDQKGLWPAFWMMPQDSEYGNWPKSGEIDIMENAPSTCGNHVAFSTLHAQGHYAGNGAGIGKKSFGEDFNQKFHKFGILWEENKITCFYDGESVGSYTNDGTGPDNWPYNKEFYFILNLAVGGNLGGQGYDSAKTYEFLVDYVRVYQ